MNEQKSNTLHLVPTVVLKQGSSGEGLGHSLYQLIERLLGKRTPAPRETLHAAPAKASAEAQDFPYEFACASEQEAVALCQSLAASGHLAQVHYDVYDYSWSVEVSPAAHGAPSFPQARDSR